MEVETGTTETLIACEYLDKRNSPDTLASDLVAERQYLQLLMELNARRKCSNDVIRQSTIAISLPKSGTRTQYTLHTNTYTYGRYMRTEHAHS